MAQVFIQTPEQYLHLTFKLDPDLPKNTMRFSLFTVLAAASLGLAAPAVEADWEGQDGVSLLHLEETYVSYPLLNQPLTWRNRVATVPLARLDSRTSSATSEK